MGPGNAAAAVWVPAMGAAAVWVPAMQHLQCGFLVKPEIPEAGLSQLGCRREFIHIQENSYRLWVNQADRHLK